MSKRKTVDYQWQKIFPWNRDKITLDEHKKIIVSNKGGSKGYQKRKEELLNPTDKQKFSMRDNLSKMNLNKNLNSNSKNNIQPKIKIKYMPKQCILDDIRDWRSSKIISNVSNGFATIIMKMTRNNEMSNNEMNKLRSTIAFVTSEVLNKMFERPLEIYENIKMFIKVGKAVYKVILMFNEKTNLFELKTTTTVTYSSSEYHSFLIEYPKIKSVYYYQDKSNIGKEVIVIIDRVIGSKHPNNDTIYELNYGFIPSVYALDKEEQDAYIIDEKEPQEIYTGKVVAIIHRKNDIEDKWVVSNKNKKYTKKEIRDATFFQEKYFDIDIEV